MVDDFAEIQECFAYLLRKAGHRVLVANGAQQAQELAGGHGMIDLLVTDIYMPGMNGVELAQWFQSRFPHGKVLLVSGFALEIEAYLETTPWLPFLAKEEAFERLVPTVEKLLAETTGHLEGCSPAEIAQRVSAETKALKACLERGNAWRARAYAI